MLNHYITLFTHLRRAPNNSFGANTGNRAPHKPLLLLAVIDLFAEGRLTTPLIEPDADLCESFALYWASVMPWEMRGNVALPFFHLRSEGFWHLIPHPGMEDIARTSSGFASIRQMNEQILGAQLDQDLFGLLHDAASREILRRALIETYFAKEVHSALLEQGSTNVQVFFESEKLLAEAQAGLVKEAFVVEYSTPVRDQAFRRAVVVAYRRRCALCGIRIITSDGHSTVEAAHIIPWSISHNDDPRNGLALCPLCHWTFDEGLLGVSRTYRISASPQLAGLSVGSAHSDQGNIPGHLVMLQGREIFHPVEQSLSPSMESLAYHEQVVFRR